MLRYLMPTTALVMLLLPTTTRSEPGLPTLPFVEEVEQITGLQLKPMPAPSAPDTHGGCIYALSVSAFRCRFLGLEPPPPANDISLGLDWPTSLVAIDLAIPPFDASFSPDLATYRSQLAPVLFGTPVDVQGVGTGAVWSWTGIEGGRGMLYVVDGDRLRVMIIVQNLTEPQGRERATILAQRILSRF